MEETWKHIEGMDRIYEVSDQGRIRSEHGIKKQVIGTTGYPSTSFYVSADKKFFKKVHRLVAAAFIPNPDGKRCVNHKDGNKLNNHVSNLEWCTHRENSAHSWSAGLSKSLKGELHPRAKITESEAILVIDMHNSGLSERKIVAKIGKISRRAVRSIIHGQSWGSILRSVSKENL